MRYVYVTVLGLLLSWTPGVSWADEPPGKDLPKEGKKVSADEIDRFIMQLGDDDFAKRLQARKELETIGEPALASLKKAVESSEDPEVRKAAKTLDKAAAKRVIHPNLAARKKSQLARMLNAKSNPATPAAK